MNKKGTAIVEAAVIFPVVILTVTGMIWIMIFFYNQVAVQADMHICLSREAGEANGTKEYLLPIKQEYAIHRQGIRVSYAGDAVFMQKGLLDQAKKHLWGDHYIVRGKTVVRTTDLLKQGE